MRIGADPSELRRVAAEGPGQAFGLDHVARLLEDADGLHQARNRRSRIDAATQARALRHLARRITRLDHWVLLVAAALQHADTAPVARRLLAFGAGHAATDAIIGSTASATALPVGRLDDRDLDRITEWPALPGPWRDRVHRERLRRWAAAVEDRVDALPEEPTGPLGWLTRWVDRRLVDHTSALVDLHVDREEAAARLRAEAAGARWLLPQPGLTIWSFDPPDGTVAGAGPSVRVALGDPEAAGHLAVLLPGTGSGLHAAPAALARAGSLHGRAASLADRPAAVATVLDLYDAPADLGRAADPRPGRAAGAATAAFLDDLPAVPQRRTTVIGHSYGAFTAAQALGAGADALVLLGAPGVGVASRAELTGAREVWAAQAADEPIRAVADLDERLAALPPRLRPTTGPLADPLVALGPDPADPDFGARRLPTAPTGADDTRTANRGHVDYLEAGTVALDNVARVVLGLPPR